MTGCYTCGGGMGKHDPVAHDQVPEDDEPCMCGTDFTCLADKHDEWVYELQRRVIDVLDGLGYEVPQPES